MMPKINPAKARNPRSAHNQQGHDFYFLSTIGGGALLLLDLIDPTPQLGPLIVYTIGSSKVLSSLIIVLV